MNVKDCRAIEVLELTILLPCLDEAETIEIILTRRCRTWPAAVCGENRSLSIMDRPMARSLSTDNFRTVRMYRLIWRLSDFLGMAFAS